MKILGKIVIVIMILFIAYGLYLVTPRLPDNNMVANPNVQSVIIPAIGVNTPIVNTSINDGVYFEPQSGTPGSGTVILFGHRTTHGKWFYNLDKLTNGDNVTVNWPGVGKVKYQVLNSTIVPNSYILDPNQGNKLFLITCTPLGSSAERILVECQEVGIDE